MKNRAASKTRTRTALLWLVVLIVPLSTLFLSSPASASYYEDGVSLTGQIVRDSIPYRLNIKAVEATDGSRLDVSLSALQDPAGPTRIRQTQRWSFPLEDGEFISQGDNYRIDAGSQGSDFHVDLLVERREGEHCSEDQQLFAAVSEGGGFRIETGNEVFGAITELPPCGEPYWFSSGPLPGPPPCPRPGQQLWSSSMNVTEGRSGDLALIRVLDSAPLDVGGRSGTWSFELRGAVPGSRFRLSERLSGGFQGTGLPWLDGVARFEPSKPFDRTRYDCRGQREARIASREGAIRGDLTLDVIGTQEQRINDADAVASRSRVRPR